MNRTPNPHAKALGKLGGKVRSPAKAAAARKNGKKGGRPRLSSIGRGKMSEVPNKSDYLLLRKLDDLSKGKLNGALNRNGAANLTVCPFCRVDDFMHIEGCKLESEK